MPIEIHALTTVTRKGSGIGQEASLSFAAAGAAHIVLLGRTEATLKETASRVASASPGVTTAVRVCDLTKEETLRDAATAIGRWHILIIASAYAAERSSILSADLGGWWQVYETNVKGTLLAARTFIPTADPDHAALLGLTSGVTPMLASYLTGISAYVSSSLAKTKIYEYLAAENPGIFIASVHPGFVLTDVFSANGGNPDELAMDDKRLSADFLVWMASPEAAFLRGRSIWANWDVDELKALEPKITEGNLFTAGLNNWPYTPNVQ
ncbi:hypothetical protein SLS62_007937 [Diatrype stigma]|uniref:Uncharacterized protein n=1 Tax=Diatrype stigma TaxID=117547 RepID=A0AAN9YN30_9PEZI